MLAVNKEYPIIYDALEQLSSYGIYYAIDVLDIKNGYMSISGALEGQWNMCYWNLKNKNIFIAVYHEGCGPLCYVESFTFYIYENNSLKQQAYSSIIPVSWNDFLAVSPEIAEKKMVEKDIPASLLFELPQLGKNIIAKWGNTGVYTDYKGIAKGTRMTLIWNDGKFTKGEFYWE